MKDFTGVGVEDADDGNGEVYLSDRRPRIKTRNECCEKKSLPGGSH